MTAETPGVEVARSGSIRLEVCVDSADGLAAAARGGADRIELCAALGAAGLTPSMGLMRLAAALPTPAYAMIRPRPGDYVCSSMDVEAMRGDIDAAREAGLAGVVLGVCHADGTLDEDVLANLLAHAAGLGATLHRVFDATPDLERALETAIDLGFERVLTSGGASDAPAGAVVIAGLERQAAGRIIVMAGGGLAPANLAGFARATGVREVHGSFSGPGDDASSARWRRLAEVFGAGFAPPRDTLEAAVAEAARILRGLA